jgi:hypothetical protein
MGTHIRRVGLYAGIAKALIRYEIDQQADNNHRLKRLLIEASVKPSLLCPTNGYQHPRWVYKGQRWPRSTGSSESDTSNTLCVPMGIRIGRVSLYAGMPNLDGLHPQADYNHWLERLLIEASVIPSLLCPTDGYQHPRWVYKGQRWLRLTDISNPDVNHALCVPMGTHIERVSLYAGMSKLWHATKLVSKPTTIINWNAYW